MATITEPGIYDGIEESAYHADAPIAPRRSLSQTGAKTLLRSARRFVWERDHGRPPKDAFDQGSLAHALILRSRDDRIRIVDAYDWRLKVSQEAKKAAQAQRLVVGNRGTLLLASKIARAVRRDPIAGPIFAKGRPEVTAYWTDDETGVLCRARYDWVTDDGLYDLKTAGYGRGTEDAFGRSAAAYDYPMQAAHYIDGWKALTGIELPFTTITVETDEPYLVTVGRYTDFDLEVGRERMRRALIAYAEGERTGWAYEPVITDFTLPGWYGQTDDDDMEVD